MSAGERVQWAMDYLPDEPVLTSSFGAQSAVMLHLVTRHKPDIPVVLIDTGYLFPETYAFIDELTDRLNLNLHVFRPRLSPAWQERRFGRLWEAGPQGIRQYNRLNKVEPMQEALDSLKVGTWFSGLRRVQSKSRADTPILLRQGRAVKAHPLADWSMIATSACASCERSCPSSASSSTWMPRWSSPAFAPRFEMAKLTRGSSSCHLA
jgi:phosphoadenosine phosphosulfate reductase